MQGQPTYSNTNINININIATKKEKKEIEEVAKFFASKIPKITNFDNKKSRKYFITDNNESQAITLKDNLIYVTTESTIRSKNEVPKLSVNNIAHKRNPSNILKISKEILKFAERKSTPKIFYKVPAKFMEEEDVLLESDEEELIESLPNNFKQNKTVEHGKKKKKEDSFCVMKEKLNSTDIEFISLNDNSKLNFESLLNVEHLYRLFIKELEMKKLNHEEYDNIILKYFEIITTSYESIYRIEFCVNDKPIRKSLKEFFVQELVVFSLAFNRSLNKNEVNSLSLYHAFKTCMFYLHQNMIILMFVCCMLHEKRISNNGHKESNAENVDDIDCEFEKLNLEKRNNNENVNVNEKNNFYLNECKKKIEENKIWLNKNNYKKHLKSNYKNVNGIIKNILKVIKGKVGVNLLTNNQNNYIKENSDSNPKSDSSANKLPISDLKNVTIIINYLKNIDIYKTEIISEKIFKNLIKSQMKNSLSIEDSLKYSFSNSTEENNSNNNNNDITIQNSEQKENSPLEDQHEVEEPDHSLNHNNNNNSQIQATYLPPSVPFLSDLPSKYQYTLVLDLDETLVHYVEDEESAYIQIRPGAENFLEEMSEYFEIVIFTAAMQDYADLVLDELDKNKNISHRLYRQHTLNMNNYYMKDLSKLGRDMTKTIIIDNVAENFQLQSSNGLHIKNFEGDENDTELIDLTLDLITISKLKIDDVRRFLPKIRHGMISRNEMYQNENNVKEDEDGEKMETQNVFYTEPANELTEDK